jgi:hypothetical protein
MLTRRQFFAATCAAAIGTKLVETPKLPRDAVVGNPWDGWKIYETGEQVIFINRETYNKLLQHDLFT